MKYAAAILILIMSITSHLSAQPDLSWSKFYGTDNHDYCYTATTTSDGGFILAGYSSVFQEPLNEHFIIKTNTSGDTIWTKKYGRNHHDVLLSSLVIDNGEYVFVGESNIPDGPFNEGYVCIMDTSGSLQTEVFYTNDYCPVVRDVVEVPGTGYALAGLGQGWNFLLMVVDSVGNVQVYESFGGYGADSVRDIILLDNGDYLLSGSSTSFSDSGSWDYYAVRVDEDGDEIWSANFGGQGADYCYNAVPAPDGGFLLVGQSDSFDDEDGDGWVVKIDEDGEEQWSQIYGGAYPDYLRPGLRVDGGYVLGGSKGNSRVRTGIDYWLLRIDDEGEILWEQTFTPGEDNDSEYCDNIMLCEDGGYALAGYTWYGGLTEATDFWLVRTEPDPLAISWYVDPSIPSDFGFRLVYPNPFNSSVNINYDLNKPANVSISVYDNSGRRIEILANAQMGVGRHSVPWNGADEASGVYFYRIDVEDESQTGMMTLLR